MSTEFSLSTLDAELREVHDERILSYFSRSVKLTALPVLGVIVAIAIVLYVQIDSKLVFVWLIQALLVQIPRLYLAATIIDPSTGTVKYRIALGRVLALFTGLSMGSAALFAPLMTIETMAIISMILVGTSAASIATCQGYKPIYFSAVGPLLLAIICIWCFGDSGHEMPWFRLMVVLLTVQIGVVFYSLIGQLHGFFVQNIVTQNRLQQALRAEKGASSAKTRFLAAASHDLRQPLHAMALFSAALAIRPLDNQSKIIAVKMNEAMKALSDELDSLLDISKLDADIVPVKNSTINLSDLVDRVAGSFRPRTDENNVDLHIDVQPEVYVNTDPNLLTRMLSNIFDNAVKYTEQGSVSCKLVSQGGMAMISVRDTGIGISDEAQSHVWEEFYQVGNAARNRSQGLGLGLSVVSRLAGLLKATVRIVPTDGQGTCFEVSIATIEKPVGVVVNNNDWEIEDDTTELKGRCVLIVDDDESIQVSSTILLKELGMDVLVAASTNSAVVQFRSRPVDCVVMDLRLANGDDGVDTIAQLRLIDTGLPVIIMSGDTAPDRLKKANSMGCSWLVKPVKPELLIKEINSIFL